MAAIPAYTSNPYKIVSRQLIIKMLLLVLIVIQLTALIVNFTFSGHLLRNSFYYSCSSVYHSQQRDNNPSQDEMITTTILPSISLSTAPTTAEWTGTRVTQRTKTKMTSLLSATQSILVRVESMRRIRQVFSLASFQHREILKDAASSDAPGCVI